MIDWNSLFLLAQEAAPAAPAKPPAPGLPGMLIWAVPIMVVWFVMFIMPQNKERAKRQDMLGSLKKNDSVATIGGILGTVTHVSDDGKEVTLRVDDNARIRVKRDAINEIRNLDSNNDS